MSKTEELVKNLRQEAERIKSSLQQSILDLPDNPRIHRLAPKNCFVVSSKDTAKTLNVFYHDFQAQHRLLVEVIDSAEILNLPFVLANIVATGSIKFKGQRYQFHEDVIAALVEVI